MVASKKDILLSQFEPDLAAKLLEFAHYLSSQQCDYFLFMSRKFCCLYDILLSVGAPPVQYPIVSDKVLDLDVSALADKSVHVVDDIIVCGSTMWKTKEKLLKVVGAKHVQTSAFCVNEAWWVQALNAPDYKAALLNDGRAMSFCTGIVNALSIAPRPYAVDYPIYSNVDVKVIHWTRIVSSKDWLPFDISSALQTDHKVSSLTFFPSGLVTEKLRASFGTGGYKLLDIIKVRVYTQHVGSSVRMTVMPIVTFAPMSGATLASLFASHLDTVAAHIGSPTIHSYLSSAFPSETSKLRWLQYIAAALLGGLFRNSIQESQERTISFDTRDIDIEVLFGRWNLDVVKQISGLYLASPNSRFSESVKLHPSAVDLEQTELTALIANHSENHSEQDESQIGSSEPRNIVADFNNIFVSLYKEREISARQYTRSYADEGNWEAIAKLDRLDTGLTWTGILEYLRRTFGYDISPEIKNTLSLVLDSGVDKGIAVPVIRYNADSDLIYRAYRHGEDVLFADEEVELCGLAIEEAVASIGKPVLPKIFLEKLLVLLIRIGAAKKFLDVQYGTTGQDGLAKIGFYLHGAIAKYYCGPEQYADSDIWLSRHLEEKGVIKAAPNGGYVFGKNVPSIQISPTSRFEAQKLGGILGTLYKGKEEDGKVLRLDDGDLVLLSSCWRPRDVAAALYIELFLFSKELFPLVSAYSIAYRDGKSRDPSATLIRLLRSKGHTALNSLRFKFAGWVSGGAVAAKDKGARLLEKLGQRSAMLDWNAYWASQDILKREDEEKVFDDLLIEMARLGHQMLFAIILFEVHLKAAIATSEHRNVADEKSVGDALLWTLNFFESANRTQPGLLSANDQKAVSRLQDLRTKNFNDYREDAFLTYIWQNIERLNREIGDCLSRVRTELQIFELRGDSVTYSHMIYYDIVDSTATKRVREGREVGEYRVRIAKTKEAINSILTKMEREATADKEEIYCWNGDAQSTNDAKFIFFTGRRLGFSLRRVSDFLDRLYALATPELHFRALVVPCDAFNSPVFRLFHKIEVDGTQYWEHLSRVMKQMTKLEEMHSADRNGILVLDKRLATDLARRSPRLAKRVWEGDIETEIAGSQKKNSAELWSV
ncbi:MAG: hypothetical protein KF778_12705 [Rhodocyclaceae bacterium]|nr:hypothetical protein [Rhodocyclaceae bacterium]